MQKSVGKICLFVAKIFVIRYKFVMDEKKEEKNYFGQADMLNEKFIKKDVNLLQVNK